MREQQPPHLLFFYDLVVYEQLHVMIYPLRTVVCEVIELLIHHRGVKMERLITVETPDCAAKGINAHDLKRAMPARSEGGERREHITVGHCSLWLREWTKVTYSVCDRARSKYETCCII